LLPAWITGLAFIAANLGALEILGLAANGAKYEVATVQGRRASTSTSGRAS
jgi:solute:Na+ symporter, SSS family